MMYNEYYLSFRKLCVGIALFEVQYLGIIDGSIFMNEVIIHVIYFGGLTKLPPPDEQVVVEDISGDPLPVA